MLIIPQKSQFYTGETCGVVGVSSARPPPPTLWAWSREADPVPWGGSLQVGQGREPRSLGSSGLFIPAVLGLPGAERTELPGRWT